MADKKPDFVTAVRAVIAAIETGNGFNSEQARLLQYAKAALGDGHEPACPHHNTFYEEGDVLTCQDCRAVLGKAE